MSQRRGRRQEWKHAGSVCPETHSMIRADKPSAVKPATVSSAELAGMCSFNQKICFFFNVESWLRGIKKLVSLAFCHALQYFVLENPHKNVLVQAANVKVTVILPGFDHLHFLWDCNCSFSV